ncbi:hypothetical protein H2203_001344 [Taxawa tesnikishii (nom. ined.)]|nr:hypothetical protein H2203_001344 [Dothideales sp. JES 119]
MVSDNPTTPNRTRTNTGTSLQSASRSIRSASMRLMEVDPPPGMWAATANATSKAPTISEIRRGSFGHGGWAEAAQEDECWGKSRVIKKGSSGGTSSGGVEENEVRGEGGQGLTGLFPALTEEPSRLSQEQDREYDKLLHDRVEPFPDVTAQEMGLVPNSGISTVDMAPDNMIESVDPFSQPRKQPTTSTKQTPRSFRGSSEFPNGYIPPPKKPWKEATVIGLKAFWKWFLTPAGFLITLYGLNVVAWGAANHYDGCNDIESPRRKWLEIDSQILNALFCVTGFGLIPWRFRDLYWLLKFRLCSEQKEGRKEKMIGLRRLAGIHKGWFRLPGSDTLDEITPSAYEAQVLGRRSNGKASANASPTATSSGSGSDIAQEDDERLPLPLSKKPDDPLTGVRASPTAVWKMDFVVWCNVWNTFLQACLCGFMWGMNRYNRPSWSTGLFIALACIIAGVGGIMMFVEGKAVKKVEGVPVKTEQRIEDIEAGIEMKRQQRRSHESSRKQPGVKVSDESG